MPAMRPWITGAAAAVAAVVIFCGALSAKELNVSPYAANPQVQVPKCPPPLTGTWPACVCPPGHICGVPPRPPPQAKLCFWRENNGTLFGVSGNCPAASSLEVGAPCTCERTVEHKVVVHHGTVVAAPAAGPASVIH